MTHSSEELEQIYRNRFSGKDDYRQAVWSVLGTFFGRWIPPAAAVLDLGAGYCEFINHVRAERRIAMDLNPETGNRAAGDIAVLQHDCAEPWPIPSASLDAVFTSNFFEHLPTKAHLERTLSETYRALKPGGRLIAMGPNIKFLPGAYWDFWDHYLPLTESSLAEGLRRHRFDIEVQIDRFLPYTMSHGRTHPTWMLRAYLGLPVAWKWFGKQFLLIARRS
jgi:SAM-dependent methyltransferase